MVVRRDWNLKTIEELRDFLHEKQGDIEAQRDRLTLFNDRLRATVRLLSELLAATPDDQTNVDFDVSSDIPTDIRAVYHYIEALFPELFEDEPEAIPKIRSPRIVQEANTDEKPVVQEQLPLLVETVDEDDGNDSDNADIVEGDIIEAEEDTDSVPEEEQEPEPKIKILPMMAKFLRDTVGNPQFILESSMADAMSAYNPEWRALKLAVFIAPGNIETRPLIEDFAKQDECFFITLLEKARLDLLMILTSKVKELPIDPYSQKLGIVFGTVNKARGDAGDAEVTDEAAWSQVNETIERWIQEVQSGQVLTEREMAEYG